MSFNYSFFGFNDQVVGANKGGIVALVEGLRGFVPFSQISTVKFSSTLVNLLIMVKCCYLVTGV